MERRPKVPVFIQIILVVLVLTGAYATYRFLPIAPSIPTIYVPNSTTVVTQIQRLGKLETVSDTLEKVIVYDQNANSPLWNIFGNHKKLFLVYGDVVAGFDLSKLSNNDIQVQGKDIKTASIILNMPAPQIMSAKVDPTRTQVYDVDTGAYAVLSQEAIDPNVTLQIIAGTENSLQGDACKANILQQASDSARPQLTSLLTTIGFRTVTVNIPIGTCS